MEENLKQLLLKDLCARLPYGVKVSIGLDRMNNYIEPEAENILTLYYINPQRLECVFKECWWTAYIGAIRPYLRPISSMTEEERNELAVVCGIGYIDEKIVDFGEFLCEGSPVNIKNIYGLLDWLNKKMFDYRGLIEKGLALEAPEGMYE